MAPRAPAPAPAPAPVRSKPPRRSTSGGGGGGGAAPPRCAEAEAGVNVRAGLPGVPALCGLMYTFSVLSSTSPSVILTSCDAMSTSVTSTLLIFVTTSPTNRLPQSCAGYPE